MDLLADKGKADAVVRVVSLPFPLKILTDYNVSTSHESLVKFGKRLFMSTDQVGQTQNCGSCGHLPDV
jgi:hypothetical protein